MCAPPGLTADGYELHMGTNHLGHALLVKLLLPLLQSTAKQPDPDVRVIWTSSQMAQMPVCPGGGIDFATLQTPQDMWFGGWRRYGQSKLANILYAREFATHYPEIMSVSLHPGVANTGLVQGLDIWKKVFVKVTSSLMMKPPNEVAWTSVWSATAQRGTGEGEVETGVYYEPVGVRGRLGGQTGNEVLGSKLWEWTEEQLSGQQLE